jgi:DNA-binding Lrp family transcriptional regulator
METKGHRVDERSVVELNGRGKSGQMELDELDLRILRLCLSDCRMSYRQMAAELKVSTSTVTARVARLEKERVIRGYSAQLDYGTLGYDLTVISEVLVSKGKLLEMDKEISKLPGVCAVYDVTGEIDGIVVSKFKDREELSRFTKSLLTLPFVERSNSHVVLTTVKEDLRLKV